MSQISLKVIKDELWNYLKDDLPRQEQLKALSKMPDSEILIRAMYLSLEGDIEKGKKKMKEEIWMKKIRAITYGRPVDDPDEEEKSYIEDIASLLGADYQISDENACRIGFESSNLFNANTLVVSSKEYYWDEEDMVRITPSLLPLITTGLKSLRDQCLIPTIPFPDDEDGADFSKVPLDDIAIAEFESFKEARYKDNTLPSITSVKKILVERLSTSSDSMPKSIINTSKREHSMLVERFKAWKLGPMVKEIKTIKKGDVTIKEEPFEHEGILYIKRTHIYPGENGIVSSKILYRDCTGSELIVGVPEWRNGRNGLCFLNDDTEYGHDIRRDYISQD